MSNAKPNAQFPIRTALKIAWRETRASAVKFLFVILAVAVGVGSLTGVRGFSEAFRRTLLREARTLMAADLTVRIFVLPTPDQWKALDALKSGGVERTWITETVTMMAGSKSPDPLLVSIKAVEPNRYPFYGTVKLQPAQPLTTALTAASVAVAEDVAIRMGLSPGDQVRLGGQEFKVAAIVQSEPDRMSGSLNLGLRVLMSRDGLERTGLLREGSRAAERFLFRLPAQNAPEIGSVKTRLQELFPDGQVIDYRQTNPTITQGLNRATSFLSLISLIALIVGALGVSMALYSHLQQKLDTIAVMKSLGARSGQIIQIYVLQTLLLGLTGGLAGVLFGSIVQRLFPLLISRYFSLKPDTSWDFLSIGQGISVGLLSTLLLTLPPLLSIRRIRPSLILRREMAEVKAPWYRRLRQSWVAVASGLLIVGGIALIAAWLADSQRMGFFFAGGLVTSLICLSIVAWLLLWALRRFLRVTTLSLPSTLRHGIANLYRPGNQATTVLVAIGVGVMFTLTVYLVQKSLLVEIGRSAPPGMSNVFLLDITPADRDGVSKLVQSQPGVERKPEIIPAVAARLTKINGTPVGELNLKGWARRFLQTRSVSASATPLENAQVLKGRWWTAEQSARREAWVAIGEDAAKTLKIGPGDTIEMFASGRTFQAKVALVHRPEAIRMNAMTEFVFTPSTVEGLPVMYYGGLRVKPGQVAPLQRVLYQRYPTISVLNVADVLSIVQEVVDQIAIMVRFISVFAILAGVIILASSVAGTRFRRVRETVILKTLGATRRRIAGVFSVEFLILGTVAGLIGGLLANGFSALVLKRLFEGDYQPQVWPTVVAVVGTALIANAAGWLASFRILGQKPLEILREE